MLHAISMLLISLVEVCFVTYCVMSSSSTTNCFIFRTKQMKLTDTIIIIVHTLVISKRVLRNVILSKVRTTFVFVTWQPITPNNQITNKLI